jgi:hypothetical protein
MLWALSRRAVFSGGSLVISMCLPAVDNNEIELWQILFLQQFGTTEMDDPCGLFSSRTSFAEYVELMQNWMSNNLTALAPCKREICCTLWGNGNPDISGVGVCQSSSH